MLTQFSKVLVVFVTTISIASLGVTLAVVNSGPNWKAEAALLTDYDFAQTGGEKPTWSVNHRKDPKAIKQAVAHPEVIAAAYDHAINQTKTEIDAIKPRIKPEQELVERTKQWIEIDLRGLDERRKLLHEQTKALNKELADTSAASIRAGEETLKIRGEAERRRSDVARLSRTLDLIEADQFQLAEQKKRLLDMLFQMQGLRDRLKERAADLEQESGVTN